MVRLVQDKASGAAFALKSMRKQKVFEMGQVEHITAECKLLSECDHPFITNLVRTTLIGVKQLEQQTALCRS